MTEPLPQSVAGLSLAGQAGANQNATEFGPFAGSQCLSNCVAYLVSSYHADESPILEKEELNKVLHLGARLDAFLRTGGFLPPDQFAQLADCPSALRTDSWSYVILRSPEYFGLLGVESAVRQPFIISLENLLNKKYETEAQYVLFITGGKSLAVVIKSSALYMFDPHCAPGFPTSPAHVLQPRTARQLVEYIGAAGQEYTGCFLYFVPPEWAESNPQGYAAAHFKTLDIEEPTGPFADLSGHADVDVIQTTKSNVNFPTLESFMPAADKDALDPTRITESDTTETPPSSTRSSTPMPSASEGWLTPSRPSTPFSQATTPGKRKRQGSMDLTPADIHELFEMSAPPPTSYSETLEPEVLWIDDDAGSLLQDATDTADTASETEDASVQPEDTSLFSRLASGTETEEMTDETDLAPDVDLAQSFARMDDYLAEAASFKHKKGLPVIYDKATRLPYREAVAWHTVTKLLNSVVIEQGLVSGTVDTPPSAAVNLLRFCILWARKLGAQATDVETLLDTSLEIPRLVEAFEENAFGQGDLFDRLRSKLEACLRVLEVRDRPRFRALIATINSEIDRLAGTVDYVVPATRYNGFFTDNLGRDYVIIIGPEQVSVLADKIQMLKEEIQEHNAEIEEEDAYFETALIALENFQPPPLPVQRLQNNLDYKTRVLVERLTPIESTLAVEVQGSLTELINSLQNPQDAVSVPNFGDVLARIVAVIKMLTFFASDLGIPEEPLRLPLQQLLYMGGEVAAVSNAPWDFATPAPVTPLSAVEEAKTAVSRARAEERNLGQLNQILDDIEAMLAAVVSSGAGSAAAQALSIPVLENYILNAGALIGQQTNKRYMRLRETIQNMATSEDFLVNLINGTVFYSVASNLPKIADVLNQNPALAGTDKVVEAFNTTAALMAREALDALKKRIITQVDQAELGAFQTFMSYSTTQGNEDFARVVLLLAGIATRAAAPHPDHAQIIADLESVKRKFSNSDLHGTLKRELYLVLQKEIKDAKSEQRRETAEEYQRRADAFDPKTVDEARTFIASAPDKVSKQYAQRALRDKIRALKKAAAESDSQVSRMIVDAEQSRGEQAWQKIQNCFRNLTFELLTAEDWSALGAEYARAGSELGQTLGQELLLLVSGVQDSIRSLVEKRLASLFPSGPTFQPPPFDWITPYASHAVFFLKTINLPKVAAAAAATDRDISLLRQSVTAGSLTEATVGTNLEVPSTAALAIIEEIQTISNDFIINARTDTGAYLDALRDGQKQPLSGRPLLQAPTSLLTTVQSDRVKQLPEFLQGAIRDRETAAVKETQAEATALQASIEAAEAQFRISREEAVARMVNTIASLLPVAPAPISATKAMDAGDPLGFLERLLRDPAVMERPSYAATAECVAWTSQAAMAVAAICPPHERVRVQRLLDEATTRRQAAQELLDIENSASAGDDLGALERALQTLDPRRVRGGKQSFDSWRQRAEELQSLLRFVQTVGALKSEAETVRDAVKQTMSVTQLRALHNRAQRVLSACKEGRLETRESQFYLAACELEAYVRFKLQFLERYEEGQPEVFQKYPLGQDAGLSVPVSGPYSAKDRLAWAVVTAPGDTSSWRWVETRPLVDDVRAAHIPPRPAPPLHYTFIFHNLLQPSLFTLAQSSRWGRRTATLPGTQTVRAGGEAAAALREQWPTILVDARQVLHAYREGAIDASAQKNEFLAMTIFSHMAFLAAQEAPPRTTDDGTAEPVRLTLAQWCYLLVNMWPRIVAACLAERSFAEGVRMLTTVTPGLWTLSPQLTLENDVRRSKPETPYSSFPPPSAFFFVPSHWREVSLLEMLWQRPAFVKFCGGEESHCRAHFLAWALQTVDVAIIDQLWATLGPRGDFSDPAALLATLVSQTYATSLPTVVASTSDGLSVPYPYGEPTGQSIGATQKAARARGTTKLSAFEVALGALVFAQPLHIVLDTGKPLVTGTRSGDLYLVSPILSCTRDSEPFASLAAAPRQPLSLADGPGTGPNTTEELRVFARQIAWLLDLAAGQEPVDAPIVVVMANLQNYVRAAYEPRPADETSPPMRIIVTVGRNEGWPRDAMVSALSKETIPSAPEYVGALLTKLTKPYTNIISTEIFSRVPADLRDGAQSAPFTHSETLAHERPSQATSPPQYYFPIAHSDSRGHRDSPVPSELPKVPPTPLTEAAPVKDERLPKQYWDSTSRQGDVSLIGAKPLGVPYVPPPGDAHTDSLTNTLADPRHVDGTLLSRTSPWETQKNNLSPPIPSSSRERVSDYLQTWFPRPTLNASPTQEPKTSGEYFQKPSAPTHAKVLEKAPTAHKELLRPAPRARNYDFGLDWTPKPSSQPLAENAATVPSLKLVKPQLSKHKSNDNANSDHQFPSVAVQARRKLVYDTPSPPVDASNVQSLSQVGPSSYPGSQRDSNQAPSLDYSREVTSLKDSLGQTPATPIIIHMPRQAAAAANGSRPILLNLSDDSRPPKQEKPKPRLMPPMSQPPNAQSLAKRIPEVSTGDLTQPFQTPIFQAFKHRTPLTPLVDDVLIPTVTSSPRTLEDLILPPAPRGRRPRVEPIVQNLDPAFDINEEIRRLRLDRSRQSLERFIDSLHRRAMQAQESLQRTVDRLKRMYL